VKAKTWVFGPRARYFSFFGAVEAPEEEPDEFTLVRLLQHRKTLWEDESDGIAARAVRGPRKGTAVLEIRSIRAGWREVGVVYWPLRFLSPGGPAGNLRYGVGEFPPRARLVSLEEFVRRG
jgi:hypothetical protein